MRQVAVVTDSAASIPQELSSQYEIDVVPLSLVLDGRSYPDTLDGNTHEFYRSLKAARRPPMTSGASPGAHLEAFHRAAERAPSVLYVSVSTKFSGTYASAVQAAELFRNERPGIPLEVIDSDAAAMAQGFVVLEAARATSGGAPLEEAIRRAKSAMPKVGIIAMIDTLEYLARGGRVPKVQAWATALLSVKPILELRQTDVRLLTRPRTKRRAVAQLVSLLGQRGWKGQGLHLCVQHTNALEEAQDLAAEARRQLQPAELLISEFTLVMGAHIGPGLLALAYFLEQ